MNKKIYYIALLIFTLGLTSIYHGISFATDDLNSSSFTFDINSLTPSTVKTYTNGPKSNITALLAKITDILLIVIPSFAVLFMVYGGIKIIVAGGDSSEIQNGKKIITFNIIAVVIALLSYSIIQLTIWLIGSSM